MDRTFNSQRLSRLDHRSSGGLSLRGVTLWAEEAVCWGVQILCGLLKRVGCAIGWGRTFEGTVCAIKENKPKDTRVGSVSTGKDDVSR